MKSTVKLNWITRSQRLVPGVFLAALLALVGTLPVLADSEAKVIPPNSSKYGNNYADWSAAWFQWFMSQPVEGHPGNDSPGFDVTAGQSGDVWFLAANYSTEPRICTIPAGKALFFPMYNAECSSHEPVPFYGATAKDQRACAKYWADHIVQPFCEIDGNAVAKPESYQVTSPQFTFTAPEPWIFGAEGGTGTAVGNGYYILLSPLSPGEHTLRFGGILRFTLEEDGEEWDAPIDMTYHLTVE